ncbi:MAG TPA: hypothetical protein VNM22_14615 [Candidatus Limnocylindrales bacterium]|nr:hypothetical protein [Candidatus Limnocylindrales bacterium]
METTLKLISYFGFFLLFCLPGFPLGLWLCGKNIRKHPEAIAYGFLLGHFLSSGIAVVLIYLFGFSSLSIWIFIGLALAWLVISFKYLLRDRSGVSLSNPTGGDEGRWSPGRELQTHAKLPLKGWNRRTYISYGVLVVITLALAFEPFANLGKKTSAGYAYRKYFLGDVVKQMVITAELVKGEIPPQNPWVAGETLHYYWLYFIPSATFYRLTGMEISIKALTVLSTLLSDVLFLFMLLSTLRLFTKREIVPFLTILIGIGAYSYEAIYLWWVLGGSFTSFLEQARAYNLDGLTRWFWGEPQMDGFFRSILYSPQHLQSLSILLGVITIFTLGRVLQSPSLALMTGFMVGVSAGYSLFIGLFITLWYGLCLGIQLLSGKKFKKQWPSFLLSMGIAGLLIILYYSLGMFIRDPNTGLIIHVGRALKKYGPLVFLMNYGPPFIFGIPGIILVWKRNRKREDWENGKIGVPIPFHSSGTGTAALWPSYGFPFLFLLLLLILTITVISTVALKGFLSDVSLKLGLVLVATLLIFSAISLEFLYEKWSRPAFYFWVGLISLPALLTVLMDRSHLADIYNTKFTYYVSEEDMQAVTWIRTQVPELAVVQSLPPEYKITYLTLVPMLGQRRTAISDWFYSRIFQIPQTKVDHRQKDISRLFETNNLVEAQEILKRYQIDYVYVGEWEKSSYPFGVQKFYHFPRLFEKVYSNSKVDIFKVRSYELELITLNMKTPLPIQVKENRTALVVLKNQDSFQSHTLNIQAEAVPRETSSLPDETSSINGQQVTVRLDGGEEKSISIPLPAPNHPGVYTLILQAAQPGDEEDNRETFSVEAESVKGNLGKIQEDPEASGGKAVFIGAEPGSSGTWTFLLNRKFLPGDYTLSLRVKAESNQLADKIFTWEVIANHQEDQGQLEVTGTAFQEPDMYQNFNLNFHLAEADTFKFRIRYYGKIDIWIDNISFVYHRKNPGFLLARKVYPIGIQIEKPE